MGVVELPLVNTNKKSAPPSGAPMSAPMGIIQSLASGFDLVTRHPQLMLLPILLDLPKLGLPAQATATDALTGEQVPPAGGQVTVPMAAETLRLILVQ